MVLMHESTLSEILFNVSPKHDKKFGQKVASVRWGNSLPIFDSRFHHTMIKQISVVETW